MTLKKVLQWE